MLRGGDVKGNVRQDLALYSFSRNPVKDGTVSVSQMK